MDGGWNPAQPDTDLRTVTRYDVLNRPYAMIQNYVDGVSTPSEPDTDRITEYRYNAVGNRVTTIDPLGRVNVTGYDGLNRPGTMVTNCTDGAGTPRLNALLPTDCAAGHGTGNDQNLVQTTTYTVRGETATTTDALGRVTHTYYDALGQVTRTVANEGGSVFPMNVTTGYGYDVLGNTLVVTDALGNVTHSAYNVASWRIS